MPEEVARLWRPTVSQLCAFAYRCSRPSPEAELWRYQDPSYWDWGAGVFGFSPPAVLHIRHAMRRTDLRRAAVRRVAALCLQHVPDVELHQVHLHLRCALQCPVPRSCIALSSRETKFGQTWY
eukprot:2765356-Rhodomonas_salina.4